MVHDKVELVDHNAALEAPMDVGAWTRPVTGGDLQMRYRMTSAPELTVRSGRPSRLLRGHGQVFRAVVSHVMGLHPSPCLRA